jgi:hypothetical protein
MQERIINSKACWLGFVILLICDTVTAQEIPTKQQDSSLQFFGLYSYVQGHYYPSNNSGISLGADLNLRPLSLIQPSLEVRATFAPGPDQHETTYDFGPRVEANLNRLHPYAFALIGTGTITFPHPVIYPSGPYSHDNSVVFSGGVGVDYVLTPRFGIRGDLMVQRWNLGGANTTIIFHPRLYSFGVDYHFDFNRPLFRRHQ